MEQALDDKARRHRLRPQGQAPGFKPAQIQHIVEVQQEAFAPFDDALQLMMDLRRQGFVLQGLDGQAHPGQRGLDVMDDHGEKIGIGRDPVPLFLEEPGLFPQSPDHGIEGLRQVPQLIPAGHRDIPGQLLQGGFPGALGQVGDLAAHAGGEPEAEEPADARRPRPPPRR